MTDKRDNIIDNAMELFAQKGFEGTSIRDIADKASVNIAMVNYYFGSKEKLFEAIVEKKSKLSRDFIAEIAGNKTMSDIEKIDFVVDSYVERLFTHRAFHRLIHQELTLSQRDSLQQIIVEKLLPNSLNIRIIIESGIKKNVFKKVDIPLTIASLTGTINQVLLSRKFCNKMIDKDPDYMPYDDETFRARVKKHIKQLMHSHLLK